jgi:MYXO-CTERM domain-containing protein
MTSNGNGTNAAAQVARWLAVIGALNWGLVGFFDWDLVRAILGNETGTSASAGSRVVYALVGLAGVALAVLSPRRRSAAEAGRLAGATSR